MPDPAPPQLYTMKYSNLVQALLICFFLSSCQYERPQQFFDTVVLNTNYIADFAPEVFGRRLDQEAAEYPDIPSSKKNGDEAQQVVSIKIQSIEKAMAAIQKIDASGADAEALKQKSLELFETVLPAYKNEYFAYAKLCDSKGTDSEKQLLLAKIESHYMPAADALFVALQEMGKSYATKHNLNVNWNN